MGMVTELVSYTLKRSQNLTGRRPHESLNEFLNLTTAASCLTVITKGLLLYKSARAPEMTDNESYLRLHAVSKITPNSSYPLPLLWIFSPVLQTEILNIMDV